MPRVDYTGKNVDELLAGPYKEAVAAIKADPSVEAAIAKYKAENEEYGFLLDDLFILRYAISHTDDNETASKAVVSTLEWRHEHQTLLRPYHIITDPESGKEVRRDPDELTTNPLSFRAWSQHLPGYNEFSQYSIASIHGTNQHGGPVFYVRPGIANTHEAEHATSAENLKNVFMLTKEPGYVLCDAITRKTRLLVKSSAIIDVKGMGFSSMPSSSFRKMQTETSHQTELFYPQYVGKMIMVNIPILLRVVMEGFFMLMPASLKEKMVIAAPPPADRVAAVLEKKKAAQETGSEGATKEATITTEDASSAKKNNTSDAVVADGGVDCHIFDTYHGIPYENLPSFLGGPCRCGKPRINYKTGEPIFDANAMDKHGVPAGWCVDGVPNNLKEMIPKIKETDVSSTD